LIVSAAVNGIRSSSQTRVERNIMIDGVGKSGGAGRVDLGRSAAAGKAAVAGGRASSSSPASPVASAVTEIVAAGAPIDSAKVAAIRAAIQEGRYPVDPAKIAEKMIEFDLPGRA
jgi:negative regulator of flagellin synthesis FlgM